MVHEFVSWTDGGGTFQTLLSFYIHIYISSVVLLSVHGQCGAPAQQQPWVWINESILTRQYRLMLDSAVFFSSNVYHWILMFSNCQVMQQLWLVRPWRRAWGRVAEWIRAAEKEKKKKKKRRKKTCSLLLLTSCRKIVAAGDLGFARLAAV